MYQQYLEQQLIHETPSIIYASDLETYEIYFMNKALQDMVGNPPKEEWRKMKCYELLQGKTEPCEFCTNHLLSEDKMYEWSYYNPILKHYYSLRDKIITMPDGKKLRLEVGYNITDTYSTLTQEKALNACIETLHTHKTPKESIDRLLKILASYYEAERGYIFEITEDKEYISNTYEYCEPGVRQEINNLQRLPLSCVEKWFERYREAGEFYIDSLTEELPKDSPDYIILEAQGIHSLVTAPLCDKYGSITGFIGVDNPKANIRLTGLIRSVAQFISDFLDKTELINKLHSLSYMDSLTGLKNRRSYTRLLDEYELDSPSKLGILYVDINGLKQINDSKGHKEGDKVLVLLASILKKYFPDSAYRLGGDEFIVLLENIEEETFHNEVERLKERIDAHIDLNASIGSTWSSYCRNVIEQIDHADSLMYLDKQQYYKHAQANPKYRNMLLNTLKAELEQKFFMVYLQPQIDLQTSEVVGAEALIRKLSPHGNIVPPDSFIPLYESLGIIAHIDFFVFKSVCETLQAWKSINPDKDIQISINFSRHTLVHDNLLPSLCRLCQRYEVNPRQIIIEITESMQSLDKYQQMAIIKEFSEHGFSVALDDFGSGYSNLSMLAEANFDEVKIDKSLVDNIIESEKTSSLIKNVIKVCRDLHINSSVAEGIETEEQANLLRSLNCRKGQGFFFSRPISVEHFTTKYIVNG